jgi:hypothetical protein
MLGSVPVSGSVARAAATSARARPEGVFRREAMSPARLVAPTGARSSPTKARTTVRCAASSARCARAISSTRCALSATDIDRSGAVDASRGELVGTLDESQHVRLLRADVLLHSRDGRGRH